MMTTVARSDDLAGLRTRLARDLDGAFPDLVERLSPGLYSGALRMLGDRHDAEDVTQDALIRAYQALSTYPRQRIAEMRLDGWVWTIAANLCRNRLRQRSRRPAVPIDDLNTVDEARLPDDVALAGETSDELAEHLLKLTWPMRSAVVLRHVVGLSADEIATALGRPPATVRSDISRGLARLRTLYAEEAPHDG